MSCLRLCSADEVHIYHTVTLHAIYPILSISFPLMPWQLKAPGHQQAWCWPNKPEYSVFSIRRVKTEGNMSGFVSSFAMLMKPFSCTIELFRWYDSKLWQCDKIVHMQFHNDIIFHGGFMRGIYRSSVDSSRKGPAIALMYFIASPNKAFSKNRVVGDMRRFNADATPR